MKSFLILVFLASYYGDITEDFVRLRGAEANEEKVLVRKIREHRSLRRYNVDGRIRLK
jgi:hypothetical protein